MSPSSTLLLLALAAVVALIVLIARFKLSDRQADAILAMRLARLTGLAIEELERELGEVRAFIGEMRAILGSRERRMAIMKEELARVVPVTEIESPTPAAAR